ncbi:MAG: Double zinc ribbon [Gemmatimonadetes bacterium]|nr:Double zinc ribbon [Gemmatimonadota bacterium]
MDSVDRMYRHLVRTIRSRFPQYLTQPFDVSELHTTILPYRHHRRELGIETNEDYEITLTELLSGARDYLIVDDRMRDTLRSELGAVNPDPTAFKQFASATIALSPAALRSLEAGPPDESSPPRTPAAPAAAAAPASVPPRAPTPAAAASAPAPNVVRPSGSSVPGTGAVIPEAGDRCRACDEVLPPGRPITFCPHCGQNVTTMNCPACGSELEVGWKFCPTCGRPAPAA